MLCRRPRGPCRGTRRGRPPPRRAARPRPRAARSARCIRTLSDSRTSRVPLVRIAGGNPVRSPNNGEMYGCRGRDRRRTARSPGRPRREDVVEPDVRLRRCRPTAVRSNAPVLSTTAAGSGSPSSRARSDQRRREVPAGRRAAHDDLLGAPLLEQHAVCREAVVERRRERVVGRHPVVDRPDRGRPRPRSWQWRATGRWGRRPGSRNHRGSRGTHAAVARRHAVGRDDVHGEVTEITFLDVGGWRRARLPTISITNASYRRSAPSTRRRRLRPASPCPGGRSGRGPGLAALPGSRTSAPGCRTRRHVQRRSLVSGRRQDASSSRATFVSGG